MKIKSSKIGLLLGLGLISGSLTAAEPSLLAPLRPGMSWEIWELAEEDRTVPPKLQPPGRNPPEARLGEKGRLLQHNVMGKNFRLQKIHFSESEEQTRYVTRHFVFEKDPGSGEMLMQEIFSDEENPAGAERYDRLQEFGWIRAEDYQGTAEIDGVECDLYMAPLLHVHRQSPLLASMQVPVRVAAIGRSDRFPRRLEGPDGVRRYVPQPSVAVPELPAQALQLNAEYRERLENLVNRYALPQ
jgi:hypothetical protein